VAVDRELILEDARSMLEGLRRMTRLVHDAAESLDARIEAEDLDGMAEAIEVREMCWRRCRRSAWRSVRNGTLIRVGTAANERRPAARTSSERWLPQAW
jgi:hypothetical protein